MNLIEAFMEDFILLNEKNTVDREGGMLTTWEEAGVIQCAVVNDTSISARIAEREGVTSTYTVTTSKDIHLKYHYVIKRARDGKVFRITSDDLDKVSPRISNLDINQYTAEKWELTA